MKINNQKGFVLAETLVVTVFLMVIFAMVYSNFYPLVGEYEKREVYDDVDGKYAAYWIKQMIESAVYDFEGDINRQANFATYGYNRFECKDLAEQDSRTVCKNIVSSLQVNGCDGQGNYCDIYITNYRIGNTEAPTGTFKDAVKNSKINRYEENCTDGSDCKNKFINNCKTSYSRKFETEAKKNKFCEDLAEKKVFSGGFQDYILALPDYSTPSLNYADYRVIVVIHNKKDNNNYFSYSTIEVTR